MSPPLVPISDGPLSIQVFNPPALPGVRVLRFRADGRLWRSVIDRFAVSLTQAGHSEWWCRGKVRSTRPGTLVLKQPGEVHRDVRRDGPSRFQVVSFDEALVSEACEALGYPASVLFRSVQLEPEHPASAPLVRLQRLLGEGSEKEASVLTQQTAFTEALAALARCRGDTAEPEPRLRLPVRRALEVLNDSLAEPISLDALAEQAGMDKFHLCRAFREEVGLPPHAYLTHLRIAQAKRLLTRGLTPSEVALQVGLYDQSQLNRHFKRIVGLTPGQFARAMHPRRAEPALTAS